MFIMTQLLQRELTCLLLRWPYDQSMISSQYEKTAYISQSTQLSGLGLSERGGGWWSVTGLEKFFLSENNMIIILGPKVFISMQNCGIFYPTPRPDNII